MTSRHLPTGFSEHYNDHEGRPLGGVTQDIGLLIHWQHGPLGRGHLRRDANGAFVETVIHAAIDRLNWYQEGEFACEENVTAIAHLKDAVEALHRRTDEREARGVEGTHQK